MTHRDRLISYLFDVSDRDRQEAYRLVCQHHNKPVAELGNGQLDALCLLVAMSRNRRFIESHIELKPQQAPENPYCLKCRKPLQVATGRTWANRRTVFRCNLCRAEMVSQYSRQWTAERIAGAQKRKQMRHARKLDGDLLTVARAATKGLPLDVREDVTQMLCVGLLSGEILLSEVGNFVREYSREAYKGFSSRYNHIFIDHPLPNGTYLHDVLAG